MKTTPFILLALTLSLHGGVSRAADADPLAREHAFEAVTQRVYDKARELVRWGDFDSLERLYLQAADERVLKGASLSLIDQEGLVGDAVDAWQSAHRDNDRSYETQLELMRQWTQRRPKLALAHIAYAKVLSQYAWSVRGGSYAREIPSERMRKFGSLSDKALSYLRSHRQLVEADSYGRIRMLWTLRDTGADLEEIWATAERYIRLDPKQYGIYAFLGEAFAPRWGGSAEALDFVARESVKLTREQLGFGAYSRVHSAAANLEYGAGIFSNSLAKWPEMKQGFEDSLSRRPTLWLHHRFAYFACLAKDRTVLREQLELLGEDLKKKPEWWGSNGSRTQADCVRFAEQT